MWTHPQDYETWMAYDAAWIDVCDGLLRIPGESSGGDREVAQAQRLGIPVWFDLNEIPAGSPQEQETDPS